MKTPGFNAERSLYRTGGHYITGGKIWSGSRVDSYVLPQLCEVEGDTCHEYCSRYELCMLDPGLEGQPPDPAVCLLLKDRCDDWCSRYAECLSPGPRVPGDPGFCGGLLCSDGSRPISDGIHCLCPA
jgi:hypothetical protein